MNPKSSFESRVAALISAYADRAPIDVDPNTLTRLVASRRTRRAFSPLAFGDAGLAFVLVVVGLLITLVAGAVLVGADPFRRDPEEIFKERAIVVPFTGLPPDGAAPSDPETGELVFSFYGRVDAIDHDLHRMWVYSDGRLIWTRNLDVMSKSGQRVFDGLEPTTAIIEQRLTPVGVELLRAKLSAASLKNVRPVVPGATQWNLPGVLWGGLTVRTALGLMEADWSDGRLPALLADPESWLPPDAWQDRRLGGYVPARYAVCMWPGDSDQAIGRLPDRLQAMLRAAPVASLDASPPLNDGCRAVATEDAREVVAAFLADPLISREDSDGPRYRMAEPETVFDVLPMLPDDGIVCWCG